MSDDIRTGLKLCLIVVIATFALSFTNMLTEDRIKEVDSVKSGDEIKIAVLPGADEFVQLDAPSLSDYPNVLEVFEGKSDGDLVGYVIKSSAKGYKGILEILVGIKSDGTLGGMRLVNHKETKNIGTKAEEPEFYEQFKGKTAKVPLEDGDLDLISGATFTSKAVQTATNKAIEYYQNVFIGGGGN